MQNIDDLMDPAVQECPYGYYARLRAQAPVYRMPNTGFHLVTGFDVAREAIRQPDLFLSGVSPMALADDGIPQEIIDIYTSGGWLPLASCSTSDPPQHTRIRRFLEGLFTAERVRRATPMIDKVAAELIESFGERTQVAFVRDFAHPLPMYVIADLIGVPRSDIARFKAWSDAIVEPFSLMVTRERRIECAKLVVEMQQYFAAMIAERRREPRDDMLTEAIQHRDADGSAFDMQELITILTIDLLASGNETTTAAISSGMKLLLEDPAPILAVRQNPRLLENLAEEILRLESPAQGMFRRCAASARLGGVELAEGELLSIRFGAANRDPGQFPDPDRIDLHRRKPGNHLAFGVGRHVCVGAALARQELVSAFRALLDRLDDFRPAPDMPAPRYLPSFFGRNLDELHLCFSHRKV
jgi:cytochrome P450